MRGVLGLEVIEKDILPYPRKPQHRKLGQQEFSELIMNDGADVLGLGAVLIIIHKPVIGSHTHIRKNGPIAPKVLVICKINLLVVQKGSGTDIEVKFSTDSKIEKVLNPCLK